MIDQLPSLRGVVHATNVEPPMSAGIPPAGRIDGIDGLRGVSILFVLFAHALGGNGFPTAHFLGRFSAIGIMGVEIFFVISGFLITHLLLREKAKTGNIALGNYYSRRALRILPVFFAFMIVVALAQAAGLLVVNAWSFAAAAFLVMNFVANPSWPVGHLWSLSVEEQFYLIWPFMLKRFDAPLCRRLSILSIIAVPLSRCLILRADPATTGILARCAPQFADCLAMGCLCALSLTRLSCNRTCRRWLNSSALCVLAFPVMIFLNSLQIRPDLMAPWIALPLTQSLIGFLAAFVLASLVVSRPRALVRIMTFPPLQAIGLISYSLYIWQQLFLDRTAHHVWNAFPYNVMAALAVGALSYWSIEGSSSRFKKRFV